MNKYYNNLHPDIKEYFSILSSEFPEWLFDYIDTPEMQRIGKISLNCGTDYSKLFNITLPYSNLDHSVGVALIIWNFTKDKKQTLAGLFHDIATPVFKHCIDFMNQDHTNQESTEEKTIDIILNSKEIMSLLNRDNIKPKEVYDYKIYPIADSKLPRVCADRLEYNFSSGLSFFKVWDLDSIRKVYNNITIGKNEDNDLELIFKDMRVCEEYINTVSKLWPEWISDKDRTVMQFLADICKSMNVKEYLTIEDLYTLSEQEVIEKILNCNDKYLVESFKKFLETDKVFLSPVYVKDKYCVKVKSKKRFIVPLVQMKYKNIRIHEVSLIAREKIVEFLNHPEPLWTYFDFEFAPYENSKTKKYFK